MKAVDLISNLFAEPAAKDAPTSADLFDALLAEASDQQAALLPDGTRAEDAAAALLAGATPGERDAGTLRLDGRAVPKLGSGQLLAARAQAAPLDPRALLAQVDAAQAGASAQPAVAPAMLRDVTGFPVRSIVNGDEVGAEEALANEALLGQVAAQIARLIAPLPTLPAEAASAAPTATTTTGASPAPRTLVGGEAEHAAAQPLVTPRANSGLGASAQIHPYAQVMQSLVSTEATQSFVAPQTAATAATPGVPGTPTAPADPRAPIIATPAAAEGASELAAQRPLSTAGERVVQPADGLPSAVQTETVATVSRGVPVRDAAASPTVLGAGVPSPAQVTQTGLPSVPQASAPSLPHATPGLPQGTRATHGAAPQAASLEAGARAATPQPQSAAPTAPVVQGQGAVVVQSAPARAGASAATPMPAIAQSPEQAPGVTPQGSTNLPATAAVSHAAPEPTSSRAAGPAQVMPASAQTVPVQVASVQSSPVQPTSPQLMQATVVPAQPPSTQPLPTPPSPPSTQPLPTQATATKPMQGSGVPTQPVAVLAQGSVTAQGPARAPERTVETPAAASSPRLQTAGADTQSGMPTLQDLQTPQTSPAPRVPPSPVAAQLGALQASDVGVSVRGRSAKAQLRDADAAQLGTLAEAAPPAPFATTVAQVTPVAAAQAAPMATAQRVMHTATGHEGPTLSSRGPSQREAAGASTPGLASGAEGRVVASLPEATRRVAQGVAVAPPETTPQAVQPAARNATDEVRASEAALMQQASAPTTATPVAQVPTQVLAPPVPLAPSPPAPPTSAQALEGGMIDAAQQQVVESELASEARGERAARASDEPLDRLSAFTRGAAIGSAISAYGGRGHAGADHRGARSGRGEGEREERDVAQTGHSLEVTARAFEQAAVQLQQPPTEPQQTAPAARPPAPMSSPVPLPELPDVDFGRVPVQPENASISLHHPDLGPIQLQVHRNQGRVEVHALIESAHAEAVLRANESGIRYGVQQSGMTLGALRVRMRDGDERELPSTTRGPLLKKRRVTNERQA